MTRYYRRLGRYAAALAFAAEIAIATLGGALKRKESLSARLGDVLSELYLLSAVLKRHADEGAPVADRRSSVVLRDRVLPHRGGARRVHAELPGASARLVAARGDAAVGRATQRPRRSRDARVRRAAHGPGATRDRLTPGVYPGPSHEGLGSVEHAFALVTKWRR